MAKEPKMTKIGQTTKCQWYKRELWEKLSKNTKTSENVNIANKIEK